MAAVPKDPVMLLSFVNTKLRDEYSSLEDFCSSYDIPAAEIDMKLNELGYVYNSEKNAYI